MPSLRTVLGLLAFAFGIGALLVPGVAATFPFEPSVVGTVGLVVVFVGLGLAWAIAGSSRSAPAPPTAESRVSLPTPGTEFDEQLSMLESPPEGRDRDRRLETRAAVTERLRSLLAFALVDRYGLTEREARSAIAAGSWTDDEYAAALFLEDDPEWSVRAVVSELRPFGDAAEGREIRRAVDEVYALATDDQTDVPAREALLRSGAEDASATPANGDDPESEREELSSP